MRKEFAWAATELGIASTVFMPVNVPLPKLVATKAYGAQVHLIGETVDERAGRGA